MALNLKTRKQKYFELTLVDGTLLHIMKPDKELILSMEDFEKGLKDAKSVIEVFDGVKAIALNILNRNKECKEFDALFLEQEEDGEKLYDYDVCMAIFSEYSKFTQEVLANPN